MENAVGTTQLFVCRVDGQPDLSESKRTCRSVVRNFHLQNQFDSCRAVCTSRSIPLNR